MKKLASISIIVLLFSLTINAQVKRGGNRNRPDFTAEQIATLQSKKMALHLDLDKNQQKAVYELKKKHVEERKKMRESFQRNRKDGVQATSNEHFQLQNNRLDRQIEHKAEMRKILTKEQFEKWEKGMMGKMKKGKGHMSKKGEMSEHCDYDCQNNFNRTSKRNRNRF